MLCVTGKFIDASVGKSDSRGNVNKRESMCTFHAKKVLTVKYRSHDRQK